MFSVIKLEISQKIMSISRSTADNFKNVQSFACNLTSFESKVLSKALGVNIGKRTESHRTKSRKSPKTKSHRTESQSIFFTLADKKSQDKTSQPIFLYVGRTESHNMYTLIHVCIILLCIVLKTDRDIVSGSFCCFKLYYSLSYQLAV
jgi:hypothetical protein